MITTKHFIEIAYLQEVLETLSNPFYISYWNIFSLSAMLSFSYRISYSKKFSFNLANAQYVL